MNVTVDYHHINDDGTTCGSIGGPTEQTYLTVSHKMELLVDLPYAGCTGCNNSMNHLAGYKESVIARINVYP